MRAFFILMFDKTKTSLSESLEQLNFEFPWLHLHFDFEVEVGSLECVNSVEWLEQLFQHGKRRPSIEEQFSDSFALDRDE